MNKQQKKEHVQELEKEKFNDKLNFHKTNINNKKNKNINLTVEKTFNIRRFDTQDLDLISRSVRHGNNVHGKTDITSFDFKYSHNKKLHKNIFVASVAILMLVIFLLLVLSMAHVI